MSRRWHMQVVDVPLSNIYIFHHSVNPTDARLVEILSHAQYEDIPPARGYLDDPPCWKGSYIKLTSQKVSKKFPRVFIFDGTHRAKAAFLRWERERQRRPTLRVTLEDPKLPLE